jgi:hypothetical protein
MEKKRVFRQDYVSLQRKLKFKGGDVAVILEENKPFVAFKVDDIPYSLPYRDFIVTTKLIAD